MPIVTFVTNSTPGAYASPANIVCIQRDFIPASLAELIEQ